MNNILYLIPTALSECSKMWLLPEDVALVRGLRFFIVENEKTARKHLQLIGIKTPIQQVSMLVLNKHSNIENLQPFIDFLKQAGQVGLMSEAGCPAVADPGALIVGLAHQLKFQVIPMIGPSSILMALMGSGANGQQFAFKGYLPVDNLLKLACIKQMAAKIKATGETQIFIETPYRNMVLLQSLIQNLPDDIHLCIAINLTDLTAQRIYTGSILDWKKKASLPDINKKPSVFVLW